MTATTTTNMLESPPSNRLTRQTMEFMIEEIRNVIESMDNKKAPGEDGITGEICKKAFQIFPKSITAMCSGSLRLGVFPKKWKRAKLFPTLKPGKERSEEVSKYCSISRLNVGGKVQAKVMIHNKSSRLH
jgi:hypothetical protein